jgi:hypothetical protein
MLPLHGPGACRANLQVEPIMLHRIAARARMLAVTVGPLIAVALVLAAGRRWF